MYQLHLPMNPEPTDELRRRSRLSKACLIAARRTLIPSHRLREAKFSGRTLCNVYPQPNFDFGAIRPMRTDDCRYSICYQRRYQTGNGHRADSTQVSTFERESKVFGPQPPSSGVQFGRRDESWTTAFGVNSLPPVPLHSRNSQKQNLFLTKREDGASLPACCQLYDRLSELIESYSMMFKFKC